MKAGSGKFIEELARKNNFKTPKLGFIEDGNPTAFTYGSGPWNARIVISRGIVNLLDENETKAVIAHETGHIVHLDFIVMTIAALIVSLLYELYYILARSSRKSSGGKKGGGYLIIIGLVSFVFYIIASYLLLFLSRTREYYADEFAAENAGANNLSTALIKIAYGIATVPDSESTTRLLESTRAQGISDFKVAKSFGLNYMDYRLNKNYESTKMAMVFDMKSPWAFLLELSSTHPLTGKRIVRLSEQAKEQNEQNMFNIDEVKNYPVDNGRLYTNFFVDVLIGSNIIVWPFALFLLVAGFLLNSLFLGIGLAVLSFGIMGFVHTLYRYPSGFKQSQIRDCMADIYASPVRGKPVALNGVILGRGVAGAYFGEDMVIADRTGLVYLDFESLIPIIGNLFFAVSKVEKIIGQNVSATGWFFRGLGQKVVLDRMKNGEEVVSRQKLLGFIWAGIITVVGIAVVFVGIVL